MTTRVSAVNSTQSVWNDYDIQPFHRDHIGELGQGVHRVDRILSDFNNTGFEYGLGSVTANGWITSTTSGWYADLDSSTSTIEIANDFANSGSQSLKINCTVNSGSQTPRARITENGSSFTELDQYNLIRVKPNTTYRFKGYIKISSITSGNAGGAVLGYRLVKDDLSFDGSLVESTPLSGTAAFQLVELEFTTTADTYFILLQCGIKNETGTAWFDDLTFLEAGDHLLVEEEAIPTNTVLVNTGVAYIKITKNSKDYLVRFECDASESLAIGANATGNPRKDLIVAKVDTVTDPNTNSSNIGTLEVVQGTADPSPVLPTLPANAIAIASVDVANGQTVFTNSDITDLREPIRIELLGSLGGYADTDLPSKAVANRPATGARIGSVKLSTDPDDASNPVALAENDGRVLSVQEKADVVSLLTTGSSSVGIAFTAGEDLSQGDVLGVSANDTASRFVPIPKADYRTEIDAFTGGNMHVDIMDIVALTNSLFVLSSKNLSNYTTVQAAKINKETGVWTFGVAQQLEANTSNQFGKFIKLDSTRAFFSYKQGSNNNPMVRALSVNTTDLSITLGTAQALSTYSTAGNFYRIADIGLLTTDRILCVYNHPSGKYTRVADVSGTTVNLNSEVQLSTDTSQQLIGCAPLGTNKCLAAYFNGTDTVGRVVTVTGVTVDSLNTAYTLLSGGSTDNINLESPFEHSGIGDVCAFMTATSSSNIRVHYITISGTVITADVTGDNISVSTMSNVAANARGKFIMIDGENAVFQAGGIGNASNKRMFQLRYNGTSWVEIGTNVELSQYFNAASNGTWDSGMAILPTGEIIIYSSTHEAGWYRDAVFFLMIPTGLPYGLAAGSASAAATIQVTTNGELTLTQSFTAGDQIYSGFAGVLSNTWSECISLGTMKNVNDINVNISQRRI